MLEGGGNVQDESLRDFLDQAASHRLLSSLEEQQLSRKWLHEGDEGARHQLLMHNIRLVVSIARGFMGRGLPFGDLIQAGVVGLDRATRKFDPEKGFKFSTYASWWVRQAIQRSVASEGKTIRVPNQVSTRRLQIDSLLRDNPEMTPLEMSVKLVCTEQQILQALAIAEVVVSLDKDRESATQSYFETIADVNAEDPHEAVRDGPGRVRYAITCLDTMERLVIGLRYGIDGQGEKTIQEIADTLDILPTAVQELQRDALKHLRELMK